MRAARGPAHPDTLDATQDLIVTYRMQGKAEEMRRLLDESIRLVEEQAGGEDPAALDARVRLARTFEYLSDLPEMIRILEEVLPVQQRVLGDGHHSTLVTTALLAQFYQVANRDDLAAPLLLKALPECRKSLEPNHAITSLVLGNLATHYALMKDTEKMGDCLCEAVDITRALHGPDHGFTDQGAALLGRLYLITRQLAAERYLRDHLAYQVRNAPGGAERYVTEGRLGICLLRRKADARAEASLRLAYEWIAPRIHDSSPAVLAEFREFENGVIQFYEEANDKERAAIWKARRMDLDFPAEALAPVRSAGG